MGKATTGGRYAGSCFTKTQQLFLLYQSLFLLRDAINKETNTDAMELNGKMELKNPLL